MLIELHVVNFALMEDVRLELQNGFSAFTGETGAGKSMLIDAIGVLLGGRASTDFIRHGLEKARVEGIFENLSPYILDRLAEEGYPAEEGQLFLYREINSAGRNICRVQGRTVPLSVYRTLCEGLVDIHGQMEHQSLLRTATQRNLLDAFGGSSQLELVAQVNQMAREYRTLGQKERELTVSEAERQQREEMLRYQIAEIEQVQPVPGEEEVLNQEKKRLGNAERLLNLVAGCYGDLYDGSAGGQAVYDLLGRTRRALQEFSRLDPAYAHFLEQLESIYYVVEDLAEQLRSYREGFEFEPGKLEEIEERLARLHRLRKYGYTVEEILNKQAEMHQELHQITHLQEELAVMQAEKEKVVRKYHTLALDLSDRRQEQAKRLEKELVRALADLGMDRSRIEVRLTLLSEPASGGAEEVEFYFSANPGEPPRPLAKVASGGEMSRLMLAFKSLLASVEEVGTFIFDEVDSGVGGRISQKVGEKLAKIAQTKQVLCITHAAQVAAFADDHFGIRKEVSGERTYTVVEQLDEKERIDELARMLGDSSADITRRHAQELWQRSNRI